MDDVVTGRRKLPQGQSRGWAGDIPDDGPAVDIPHFKLETQLTGSVKICAFWTVYSETGEGLIKNVANQQNVRSIWKS